MNMDEVIARINELARKVKAGETLTPEETEAHEKLEALGIDATLFDWIVSAPELGGLKPAPELLIKVAERMGVGTAECLVVGDREDTDVQLAKSVGAHYFLV